MLQILNIREAIPGHHAQLVHAKRAPLLVKSLFDHGAMTEDRAVHSESVMMDSGYGAGPAMALREQLMQRPGFTLNGFHERLLSFGSAPVREIAKAML